jgi:hypothetical protein
MMMLGQFGDSEPFRIRKTLEETIEMEAHLARVAIHFVEEISWLDQLTVELIQQRHREGLEGDERSAAGMRDLLAFIEGTTIRANCGCLLEGWDCLTATALRIACTSCAKPDMRRASRS